MATVFALIFTWAACSAMDSVCTEDDDWDDHVDDDVDYIDGVHGGASRGKKIQKKHKIDRSKGRKNHSLGSKVPEPPTTCGWCNEPDSECTKCDKCLCCGHTQDSTCVKSVDDIDDIDNIDSIDDPNMDCGNEDCDPRFCTCGPVSYAGAAGKRLLERKQARELALMMTRLYSQNPGA